MREEVARLVFPVFAAGLRNKEELLASNGTGLDRKRVQQELLGLLTAAAQTRAYIDPANVVHDFLGVRYPLASWLDEIFLMDDSPWKVVWNEFKLEESVIPGSGNRAWKFWEQAKLAERITEPDALETFYLCVVLGFRGDLGCQDAPPDGNLQAWCDNLREQLDQAQPPEAELPPERTPETDVRELTGEGRFRTMVRVAVVCVLVLAPVVAFLVVNQGWRL